MHFRRLVPRAFLMLAIPGLVIGSATPCLACSCAISTPKEFAANATSVFTGRVAEIGTTEEPFQFDEELPPSERSVFLVRFDVEAAFKGEVARVIEVRTEESSAACGFEFQEGVRYTVFTYDADGQTWTGLCTGTTTGGITPARYGLEEQPLAEAPASPSEPEPEPEPSPAMRSVAPARIGWLAAFLVAVGAILFLAVRRRHLP